MMGKIKKKGNMQQFICNVIIVNYEMHRGINERIRRINESPLYYKNERAGKILSHQG